MTINYLDGKRISVDSTDHALEGISGGWVEIGRTTLGSSNANIDVTSLADKRYLMILGDFKKSVGLQTLARYNADVGSTYSQRESTNGAADTTDVSDSSITTSATDGSDMFTIGYTSNLSTNEKLMQQWGVTRETAGGGTPPFRYEIIGKHAQTTDPISEVNFITSTSTYDSGSEVVVLGWDTTDTHTTNFWEELASVNASGSSTNLSSGTITAKKYLWVQAWVKSTSAHVTDMTFNNDTTTYAYRNSDDGAADVTSTSDSHIEIAQSSSTALFTNMFIINNSATEKLVIGHTINQGTAGSGVEPSRREFVGKYDNTASQITEIDLDSSSGDWASDSIIKVWGSD